MRGHGEAQIVSLPVLEGCHGPNPRKAWQMETKGDDFKERLEVTKRSHVAPSEQRSLEEKPSDSATLGI